MDTAFSVDDLHLERLARHLRGAPATANRKLSVSMRHVLDVIVTTDRRSLSPEDVYQILQAKGIAISPGTVRQALPALRARGLVAISMEQVAKSRYCKPAQSDQIELCCVSCGVVDVIDDTESREACSVASEALGFKLDSLRSSMRGVCATCRSVSGSRSENDVPDRV